MNPTPQYSAAEAERMMKLQDVLLKAMAKKITWWEAAEIIGVTDRTMRRWRERLATPAGFPLSHRAGGCFPFPKQAHARGAPSPLRQAEEGLRI